MNLSGMSRDWRDLKDGGHGHEGLLVDNSHVLLAVLDDLKDSSKDSSFKTT